MCAQLSSASLSRDLQSSTTAPLLAHSFHETRSSVLSLAANEDYIFSGSQNRHIAVSHSCSINTSAYHSMNYPGMGQEHLSAKERTAWTYGKHIELGTCPRGKMAVQFIRYE